MKLTDFSFDDFDPDLIQTLEVAKQAAARVMEFYHGTYKHELKEGNSPVTEADLESERILADGLKKLNYGMISEETIDTLSIHVKDRAFVIDPLDGTKDFISKTGDFSIMVGLIENNTPYFGIVICPAKNIIFFAEKGKGAYKITDNEIHRLQAQPERDFYKQKMLTSRTHNVEESRKIGGGLGIEDFEKVGSIGIKLGYIAEGFAHLYVSYSSGLGEWDACAPSIILQEAGGEVYDLNGDELRFNTEKRKMINGFVGTNGVNKDLIINEIKKYGDQQVRE